MRYKQLSLLFFNSKHRRRRRRFFAVRLSLSLSRRRPPRRLALKVPRRRHPRFRQTYSPPPPWWWWWWWCSSSPSSSLAENLPAQRAQRFIHDQQKHAREDDPDNHHTGGLQRFPGRRPFDDANLLGRA